MDEASSPDLIPEKHKCTYSIIRLRVLAFNALYLSALPVAVLLIIVLKFALP
jgi:hypothetical protein